MVRQPDRLDLSDGFCLRGHWNSQNAVGSFAPDNVSSPMLVSEIPQDLRPIILVRQASNRDLLIVKADRRKIQQLQGDLPLPWPYLSILLRNTCTRFCLTESGRPWYINTKSADHAVTLRSVRPLASETVATQEKRNPLRAA